jgi:DNA-binding transcriptional LysR family regulator
VSNTIILAGDTFPVWRHAVDLRQLKYFIAVAEERNVGRAAERLHVSQPPVTRQIRALEDELGVQLFKRTHWGVELTPAGQAMYADATALRGLAEQAADRSRRMGRGEVGRLDVGLFGSGVLSLVPQVLRRYAALRPDVNIVLLNVPHAAQLEALRQRRILIAFDRYLPEDPDLVVERVAREALFVALPATSPLASHEVVPIAALRDQPLISARDARHAQRIAALCRANGFEPLVNQEAGDMVTGLALVANGFGSEIVPESIQVLTLPGIVYRPLTGKGEAFIDLQCARLRDDASPLLPDLLQVVRDFCRSWAHSVRPWAVAKPGAAGSAASLPPARRRPASRG